jgi:hypothetical protein
MVEDILLQVAATAKKDAASSKKRKIACKLPAKENENFAMA